VKRINWRKRNLVLSRNKAPLQGADVEKGDTKTASHESDIAELKSAILAKLTLAVGKDPTAATDRDWFIAAALTVRDTVTDALGNTQTRTITINIALQSLAPLPRQRPPSPSKS
jgi:hypothetical protein